MKVKELIEILQGLDQENMVVVRGYEGGYDDVSVKPELIKLKLNVNSEWYYGNHEGTWGDDEEGFTEKGYVL